MTFFILEFISPYHHLVVPSVSRSITESCVDYSPLQCRTNLSAPKCSLCIVADIFLEKQTVTHYQLKVISSLSIRKFALIPFCVPTFPWRLMRQDTFWIRTSFMIIQSFHKNLLTTRSSSVISNQFFFAKTHSHENQCSS